MEVPVVSDELLMINSLEQVLVDIGSSSQINAENVVEDKGVEFPDWQRCWDCGCYYKPYEKTDLWAVTMKMVNESCDNCHLKKWRKFKQVIKEAADKHGFVIMNDEKEPFEIGQEVLPPITKKSEENVSTEAEKKSEENVSTKAEEGLAVTKDIPVKWYCVRCIGLGMVELTPNRSSNKKLEESIASTKADENLEEKKEVTPEVDDDVIKAIYATERRCTCWEKKDAAVKK